MSSAKLHTPYLKSPSIQIRKLAFTCDDFVGVIFIEIQTKAFCVTVCTPEWLLFYRVKHYECHHFEWFIIWHRVDNSMFVRWFCMKNGLNIIFMFDQITQLNAHLMNIQSRFAIRTVLKYSSFSLKQFNTFNNTSELLHVRTLTHIGRFTFRLSMFINSASFNTARVCVSV